ncbi:MAG: DUF559 domain-containing protein [Candidatus Binatia bacterium]
MGSSFIGSIRSSSNGSAHRRFVADFFCFERQLVIEVDGRVHDYRVDHDRLRTFIINQLGIRVVSFRNEPIETDLAGVLEELRGALLVRSGR